VQGFDVSSHNAPFAVDELFGVIATRAGIPEGDCRNIVSRLKGSVFTRKNANL
jgi:hypothetical protein